MLDVEVRWAERIFDAIYPKGVSGGLSVGARDLPLRALLADLEKNAPVDFMVGVRAAIVLVTLAGPRLTGRSRSFEELSVEERGAVLSDLAESDVYALREIPTLLKMVASLGYAAFPHVQREIGLDVVDETPPSWVPWDYAEVKR